MEVEFIEVRRDPAADPDGSRIGRFLSARIALERAVARRVFLVHVAVLLCLPLWFCTVVPGLARGLRASLWVFASAILLVGLSIYDEGVQRRAARRAARGVAVEPLEHRSRIIS